MQIVVQMLGPRNKEISHQPKLQYNRNNSCLYNSYRLEYPAVSNGLIYCCHHLLQFHNVIFLLDCNSSLRSEEEMTPINCE